MSGGQRDPVSVKIILTQYVQTDPMSFKSLVQSLTGKDSTVAETVAESSFAGRNMVKPPEFIPGGVEEIGGASVSSRDLFLEEFDRMLMELPPMDDLNGVWWAD